MTDAVAVSFTPTGGTDVAGRVRAELRYAGIGCPRWAPEGTTLAEYRLTLIAPAGVRETFSHWVVPDDEAAVDTEPSVDIILVDIADSARTGDRPLYWFREFSPGLRSAIVAMHAALSNQRKLNRLGLSPDDLYELAQDYRHRRRGGV